MRLDDIGQRGNFPEPAQTRCGDLPEGIEPIAGLASAWVVLALPDAISSDGDPVPAGSAMVRLADHALEDCNTAFFNFVCAGEAGPKLTNNAFEDLGRGPLQVPPLVGVALRPPCMHDGRSADLAGATRDMIVLTLPEREVGDAEVEAVVAYMETL